MAARAPSARDIIRVAGRTFCEDAGFTLRDQPAALFQLAVLAILLAKPIDSALAVAGAGELRRAGVRTPRGTLSTTWQQRVDALGRAHYRRFDESMATRVEEAAQWTLDAYQGDLRQLARRARGNADDAAHLLTECPGLGPAGADIFLREAQRVWPWLQPRWDGRVLAGAERLGLSRQPAALRRLFAHADAAALAAALVRAERDDTVVARLTGR